MKALAAIFLALLSTYFLTWYLRGYAQEHNLLDKPNQRSSHHEITPRGGGLSFVIIWTLIVLSGGAFGFFPLALPKAVLPGAILLAGIGFIDDHSHLSWKIRITVQILAATLLVLAVKETTFLELGIGKIAWWPYGSILVILGLVWSVNLFNFMDGIDALASLEAICVFSVGGFLFWSAGGKSEALSLWLLSATVGGFLMWNLPPAKIFMGDTGSYFLGFLIGAYALLGQVKYHIPILLWIVLYGIFWFDATVTLLKRLLGNEKWYQAHRSHAYQRLHQQGWSHGKVSVAATCLNMILAAVALAGYFNPPWIMISFFGTVVILTSIYIWVDRYVST